MLFFVKSAEKQLRVKNLHTKLVMLHKRSVKQFVLGLIETVFFSITFSVFTFSAQTDIMLKKYLTTTNITSLIPSGQFSKDKQNVIFQKGCVVNKNSQSLKIAIWGKGDTSEIQRLGGIIQTKEGNFYTAIVPLNKISKIANNDQIQSVQIGFKVHSMMNLVTKYVNASSLSNTPSNQLLYSSSLKNKVIVGIIDVGIDYKHPDFKDDSDNSRIKFLWDQTKDNSSRYPFGFTYGTEWTSDDIDNGTCTADRSPFHGTHVTGIAAGNGKQSQGLYAGVAPSADIVFVKTDLSETGLIDGIKYIITKSKSLGLPCAINISLGTQSGSHSKTDEFNQFIDKIVEDNGKQGVAIVWAAGNEGADPIHTSDIIHPDPDMNYITINYSSSSSPLYTEFYYQNSEDIPMYVSTDFSPNANQLTTNSDSQLPNVTISRNFDGYDHSISIEFSDYHAHTYYVFFGKVNKLIPIDGYIVNGEANADGVYENSFDNFTNEGTLSDFAAQSESISVGSITLRTTFTNIYGTVKSLDPNYYVPEKISPFSSIGPTRDLQNKPEVVAPGSITISTAPLSFLASISISEYLVNNYYMGLSGTSMAAPVVTGIIAHILAKNPKLTIDEIRQILTTHAKGNKFKINPGSWDNTYGYGVANLESVLATSPDKDFLVQIPNNVYSLSKQVSDYNSGIVIDVQGNKNKAIALKLKIIDGNGNLIKSFGSVSLTTNEIKQYLWEGKDDFKKTVYPGLYQLVVENNNTRMVTPLLLVN